MKRTWDFRGTLWQAFSRESPECAHVNVIFSSDQWSRKISRQKRRQNGEKKRKDRYSELRSLRQQRSQRACFVSPVDISFLLRNYSKEENSRSLVNMYYN